jgi:spermidine synthase
MTKLFSTNPVLVELNKGSLKSPKIHVINDDAFPWLDRNQDMFDFVVVDFPDPTNYSLGKLYTTAFYRLLSRHVSANGFIVVQSTSPLFARQSYWCIVNTLRQAGLKTWPYHVYVPSFGEWGFVLAGGAANYEPPIRLPDELRFLAAQNVPELFRFATDMLPVRAEVNRLNDQVLVRYYEREWKDIAH